jgi:transketolase
MDGQKARDVAILAQRIRIATLREFKAIGFGHVGGSMSIVEVLAALYGCIMKYDPRKPQSEDRDWLVLSKGHAGPALYAALALAEYFPMEELLTLNQPGTNLPSHCDRNKTPGIDVTTGSLGQGISTALGVALGHRLAKKDNYVYLIIGDGECNEGQIWEGVQFAAHWKVDHLIAFVDANKKQLDGFTKDINDLSGLDEKFACFGWHSQSVDGHDVVQIIEAVEKAKLETGRPSVIVLNTVKGKDCSFAESAFLNHHMVITPEMADEAIHQIETAMASLSS